MSGFVENLVPDEKNYVSHEVFSAGGNGINAGIIAHRLKSRVDLTGFCGGPIGEKFKALLNQEKISHHFIKIQGETRFNVTLSKQSNHQQTRLSFQGPRIRVTEKNALIKRLNQVKSKDVVLLGGSLPPGVSHSDLKQLIELACKRGAQMILDIPGGSLASVIQLPMDLIKPNLTEFQLATGTQHNSIEKILPIAKPLLKKVGRICISSIEGGALMLTRDEIWFGRIPKLKILSTVGAGDSMVGAMAFLLDQESAPSIERLLRYGLAASAATLTQRGMELGSRRSILKYLPLMELTKIS